MKTKGVFKNGELSLMVLSVLSKTSLGLDNLADRLLTPGFSHKGRLTKSQFIDYQKRCWERKKIYTREEFFLREKMKIASLIYRLQKMGLVKNESTDRKKAVWTTTDDGVTKILKLEEKLLRLFQKEKLPRTDYPILKSRHKIIVIFDIAETEKHKRDWLRQVLRRLGFRMLQKSVWVGESQLPRDLISDLEKLGILNSVKILSVFKEGNIED